MYEKTIYYTILFHCAEGMFKLASSSRNLVNGSSSSQLADFKAVNFQDLRSKTAFIFKVPKSLTFLLSGGKPFCSTISTTSLAIFSKIINKKTQLNHLPNFFI